MKKYRLEIIVFITGACVMILELVGSRVLAPYVGNSLFVWTSLIGIILGSLSIGYAWGGQLADRTPTERQLAKIILASSIATAFIALAKSSVLGAIQRTIPDIRLGAIAGTSVLFAPVSLLLGMVSPYAVKLKMRALSRSGATVGSLYAISTVGSIAGTFLAGFWLIAAFGNTLILWFIAGTLAATALICRAALQKTAVGVLFFSALGIWGTLQFQTVAEANGLIDRDTSYQRVVIYPATDAATGRPIRAMMTGPTIIQSARFVDDADEPVFPYTKFYRLADHFYPRIKEALMIGGAGYSVPRDFLRRHPDARMEVIEIDPGMTALAKQYFGLTDQPRLTIHHEDARTFLNRAGARYDVIFGDAFQTLYGIPYQLTTVEAVRGMANHLSDHGVVFVNIIAALSGDKNKFLRAELATYRAVFPQVWLFPMHPDLDPAAIQNVTLVALKSPTPPPLTSPQKEFNGYLARRFTGTLPLDLPVLTDDYAPVDQYLLPLGL